MQQNRLPLQYAEIAGQNALDGIVVMSLDGKILWANDSYCRIVKRTRDEMIGRNPLSFALPPESRPDDTVIAAFRYRPDNHRDARLSVHENIRGDGSRFWNQISVSFHTEPEGETLAVLVCRDVTEQILHQQALTRTTRQLEHVASHDPLTGAANRTSLQKFADAVLAEARYDDTKVGVMQIDVDEFKQVNDRFGHAAGDAVLCHVTDRIKRTLRRTDLLARAGGDEFIAVCPGVNSARNLRKIGQTLIESVGHVFDWQGTPIKIGISIGAALSRGAEEDLPTLLAQSDLALYKVKREGRGHCAVFNAKLDEDDRRKQRDKHDLADAIQSGTLDYAFQPIVDLETGDIRAVETFVRWKRADGSVWMPDRICALADSINQMLALDTSALNAASAMAQALIERGLTRCIVAINASRVFCEAPQTVIHIERELRRRHLDPRNLAVEVREDEIFGSDADHEALRTNLMALRRSGVHVALDNCGASFRSLSQLHNWPFNTIKIDRALIQAEPINPFCATISGLILETCSVLKMPPVATGLETPTHAERFRNLGGKIGQGFHVAHPMPHDAFLRWVDRHLTRAISA